MKTYWNLDNIYSDISNGENIEVFVLDSGCPVHADLKINNKFNQEEDLSGHSTHVCGIIQQIAPKAEIIPLKVVDVVPDLKLIIDCLKKVLKYANPNKITLVNLSISFLLDDKVIYKLIKKLHKNKISIICAAGNTTGEESWFPAKYTETISVGSYNEYKKVSCFSASDSRIDIYAPGEQIYSTWVVGTYSNKSGTSQAAPYCTGILALLLGIYGAKVDIESLKKHLKDNSFILEGGELAIDPEKTLKTPIIILDSPSIFCYIKRMMKGIYGYFSTK